MAIFDNSNEINQRTATMLMTTTALDCCLWVLYYKKCMDFFYSVRPNIWCVFPSSAVVVEAVVALVALHNLLSQTNTRTHERQETHNIRIVSLAVLSLSPSSTSSLWSQAVFEKARLSLTLWLFHTYIQHSSRINRHSYGHATHFISFQFGVVWCTLFSFRTIRCIWQAHRSHRHFLSKIFFFHCILYFQSRKY